MKRTLFVWFFLAGAILTCSQPVEVVRHSPEIKSLTADKGIVYVNEFITLQAVIVDNDEDDELVLTWTATAGTLTNTKNNPTQWHAPSTPQTVTITLTVSDGYFETSKSLEIVVKAK